MEHAEDVHCCGFCSFRSVVKKDILKHLKESHVNERGFCIGCALCGRSFTVFSSFTSHVSRLHPGVSAESAYDDDAVCTEMETDMIMEEVDAAFPDVENEEEHSISDISLSVANFIVGLKEMYLVNNY